jgi:regulator of protease activity HflC (stomatin/prohibitin superfamily)
LQVFKERQSLNANIVEAINQAAVPWGLVCLRAEIKDIALPDSVVEDMQRQVSAERRKRASVLESEGKREAAVNVAEGAKTAQILASEAERLEQVNQALGEAEAITAKAEAQAKAIEMIAKAIKEDGGDDAVKMRVAEARCPSALNRISRSRMLLDPTPAHLKRASVWSTTFLSGIHYL